MSHCSRTAELVKLRVLVVLCNVIYSHHSKKSSITSDETWVMRDEGPHPQQTKFKPLLTPPSIDNGEGVRDSIRLSNGDEGGEEKIKQ